MMDKSRSNPFKAATALAHDAGEPLLCGDSEGVVRGACRACGTCKAWVCHANSQITWHGTARSPSAELPSSCREPGVGERCECCGCPQTQHSSLTLWLRDVRDRLHAFSATKGNTVSKKTRMPWSSRLPVCAYDWEPSAAALYMLTAGRFDPRERPGRLGQSGVDARVKGMISVITPTTTSRHAFHPLLYENFRLQVHEPRELVVIDTGDLPSAFLQEQAREDPRVSYHFFPVADACEEKNRVVPRKYRRQPPGDEAWTLGLKRNLACYLARGAAIAHFDDDDLYAPHYLSFMWQKLIDAQRRKPNVSLHMAESGLGPAAATLAEWHLMDFSDQTFAFMNPENNPLVSREMKRPMQYGFGFSHTYTMAAWKLEPFADVEFSEDGLFTQGLEAKGGAVCFVRLPEDVEALAAHSFHPDSTSGGAAYVRLIGQVPTPEPFRPLLPVARDVALALGLQKSDGHWMEKQLREEQAWYFRCDLAGTWRLPTPARGVRQKKRAEKNRNPRFAIPRTVQAISACKPWSSALLQPANDHSTGNGPPAAIAGSSGASTPAAAPSSAALATGASPATWTVLGGSSSCGIVVRTERSLQSTPLPERLATGAMVEELQQVGRRMQYKKLSGAGPSLGWVSLAANGRELLRQEQRG